MKEVYLNEFNILMDDRVYLPSASGMLRAYAESRKEIKENYHFNPFLFVRQKPENIFKNYRNPAVAGFSSSLWNHQLNLVLAKMLKDNFPECLIIFGGSRVPDDAAVFLEEHPFVDVVVHGEGEETFTELLTAFLTTQDFSNVSGISYRHPQTGKCVKTSPRLPIKDINSLPSPYLSGLYDEFIGKKDLQYQIIFETMRGCPFQCSFCYWGHARSPIRTFNLERLKQEVEWMTKNKIQFIFCADSNFGMFPRDIQTPQMVADIKKKYGYPHTFRVCYGKNAEENNFQVAKLLNENGLTKAVTISRQSNNPFVLANIKRNNISMKIYESLQKRYHQLNIPVYTEFILGLPGETYDSFVSGIGEVLEGGLNDQINIFFCEALQNTDMTDPEYVKQYGIKTKRIELAEFHASRRKEGEVPEYGDIIIGTNTMSTENWKKAAAFAWIVQIFHGLKLGFFVCSYLFNKFQIKHTDFFQFVLKCARTQKFPVFNKELSIQGEFLESLLSGHSQCVFLEQFGNIAWSIDEAGYLGFSEKREEFFDELLIMTLEYLEGENIKFNLDELKEVFLYQKVRIPDYRPITVKEFNFKFNIPEYFDNFSKDKGGVIRKSLQKLILDNPRDFDNDKKEFAKEIVWFGRKDKTIINAVKWS